MNQFHRQRIASAFSALSDFAYEAHVKEAGVAATTATVTYAKSVFDSEAAVLHATFDNMPEGLQQSARGKATVIVAGFLESAARKLDGVDLITSGTVKEGWESEVVDLILVAIEFVENLW